MRSAAQGPAFPPGSDPRGFVLIGVVMFVLALTILGLSLFSLSSYEAQFLGRSRRGAQTLYDAMSGVEWARVVLARERKLQAVGSSQPAWNTRPANIVSVEAWQGNNASGNINFTSGEEVRIRVLADDQRGERRMVEMQYEPVVPDILYRHVIDSYTYVRLDAEIGGQVRRTTLDGPVRLNTDTYPNWQFDAWPPLPPPPTIGGVPLPQVASFIAANPTVNQPGNSGTGEYTLTGSGSVTFFQTATPPGATVSLYDNTDEPGEPPPPVDIIVSGTCVWMLPKGMRINRPVRVLGTSADRLVIVAGRIESIAGVTPGPDGWIIGLWFFSGIESENVPVVLVSDAQVAIHHTQQTAAPGTVNALSIFARSVDLEGPESSSPTSLNIQVLRHEVDMDGVIDELTAKGALPNLTSGGSSFVPVPGTWRELDPDNPS